MNVHEHGKNIANTLKHFATCTACVGDEWTARELFDAVRENVPCVGIVSRTERTLSLAILTENPKAFGNNDAINLATVYHQASKTRTTEPERVWS